MFNAFIGKITHTSSKSSKKIILIVMTFWLSCQSFVILCCNIMFNWLTDLHLYLAITQELFNHVDDHVNDVHLSFLDLQWGCDAQSHNGSKHSSEIFHCEESEISWCTGNGGNIVWCLGYWYETDFIAFMVFEDAKSGKVFNTKDLANKLLNLQICRLQNRDFVIIIPWGLRDIS